MAADKNEAVSLAEQNSLLSVVIGSRAGCEMVNCSLLAEGWLVFQLPVLLYKSSAG